MFEINIILIILLVMFSIGSYKSPVLNCGIWAWNGKSSKLFNPLKFDILGLYNQDRGTDSCGRAINNLVSVGVDGLSKYQDFIEKEGLTESIEKHPIAIGHTRRASVGTKTAKYAQPYLYTGKETSIIISHNGTIKNYSELAKKYGFHKKDLNDTQTLARIINKTDFDALSEYIGTASILYQDVWNDPDALYVFRGTSRATNYANVETEERPLYMLELDGEYYFSSIEKSLKLIADKKGKISQVPSNKVFRVYKGKMEVYKEIDRSKVFQTEFNNTASTNYNSKSYKGHGYYEKDYRYNHTKAQSSSAGWNPRIDRLLDEPFDNNSLAYVQFIRGRYYFKSHKLSGIHYISPRGYIYDTKPTTHEEFIITYFIDGVLITGRRHKKNGNYMSNHEAYQIASRGYKNSKTYRQKFASLLEYSEHPLIDEFELLSEYQIESCYVWNADYKYCSTYNGSFRPYFSYYTYVFEHGSLKERIKHEVYQLLEKDYNDVIEIKAIDLHKPAAVVKKCKNCNGTGYNSIGKCVVCEGTGIYNGDKKDFEEKDLDEGFVDTSICIDDFDDEYIQEYINNIVDNVLDNISEAVQEVNAIEDAYFIPKEISAKLELIQTQLKEFA